MPGICSWQDKSYTSGIELGPALEMTAEHEDKPRRATPARVGSAGGPYNFIIALAMFAASA